MRCGGGEGGCRVRRVHERGEAGGEDMEEGVWGGLRGGVV